MLFMFEETMTDLAAYLMSAHKFHYNQILGAPENYPSGFRPKRKMLRMTQHYTTALLAYGVPPSAKELNQTIEWFATPFPQSSEDEVNQVEMTRLEALLNLKPDDASIKTRLQHLIQDQRVNHLFQIAAGDAGDSEASPSTFDTLLALKVIEMARRRDLLDDLISEADIRRSLERVQEIGVTDHKDMSLLIRLQYDLFHRLEPAHEMMIHYLVQEAHDHGWVWGSDRPKFWDKLQPLIAAMQRRQLTPGLVEQQSRTFLDMIQNTCYVIENLKPLAEQYPTLQQAIHQCMGMWWRQFQGTEAVQTLRGLFTNEYDLLMALCRTVVAVSAYMGEPLGASLWLLPLREMGRKYDYKEWPEQESVEAALRRWITVEIDRHEKLTLGLSEADVVRVWAQISSPIDPHKTNLLANRTLVVKYGPEADLKRERENFQKLPHQMKHHFVMVPDTDYANDKGQAFVIIEDLHQYETLFEKFDSLLKMDQTRLPGALASFLMDIHNGGGDANASSTNNHLRDLYMLPMFQQVKQIMDYTYALSKQLSLHNGQLELYRKLEHRLNHLMARIMQYQRAVESFPLAYMHGDLHTRNIMVRTVNRPGIARSITDLEFKLIDLDSLRADGDAAHDAGQLLVDLELLPTSSKRDIPRPVIERLERMAVELEQAYLNFGLERSDSTFGIRMNLAKARAYIRIAKGLAKRSDLLVKNREHQEAMGKLLDTLNRANRAVEPLEAVYEAIKRGGVARAIKR